MIYFSSDLHFLHDRAFIWGARGFESVDEMNEEIIKRFQTLYPNYTYMDKYMNKHELKYYNEIKEMFEKDKNK